MPTRNTRTIDLPVTSTGSRRSLKVIRYGEPGARPKAYLQSSLHADEPPGMLVLHHLDRMLHEADRSGRISGEIVLVPVANPVGLGQYLHGQLSGRFALGNGVNFNRGYPDIAETVGGRVQGKLTPDAGHNVALIREQMLAAVDEARADDEVACMRKTLLSLAVDADICLDLHCDAEAPLHIYLGTPLWPDARDLAAQLGSRATLLAEVSGGNPFDEAVGGPWWALAARFPDHPVPAACLSATVELRGERDVASDLAAQDADNLLRFLMRRGLVLGDPGPVPDLLAPATPLDGVDPVTAPCAGVVVYRMKPGDRVAAGDVVAEIIDPWSEPRDEGATPVHAATSGTMFSRRSDRFARPGQILCRIAGEKPLSNRARSPMSD